MSQKLLCAGKMSHTSGDSKCQKWSQKCVNINAQKEYSFSLLFFEIWNSISFFEICLGCFMICYKNNLIKIICTQCYKFPYKHYFWCIPHTLIIWNWEPLINWSFDNLKILYFHLHLVQNIFFNFLLRFLLYFMCYLEMCYLISKYLGVFQISLCYFLV